VPLSILRRADVLIVAGDNLELLIWAGVLAGHLGLPLIQGAVHGETATCFVRVFDRSQPDGPCPGCLVGSAEWSQMKAKEGCDLKTLSLLGTEPTRTLPTVCRTTAELVATEALMWLAGTTKGVLRDQEMALSLYGHRIWCTALSRKQDCRCPHDRWSSVDLDGPPADLSLRDLLERVGQPWANSDASGHPQIRSEVPWSTLFIRLR
jgi:molybdopterin/thiamine biosynthesis adenylyltransferase